MLADSKLSTTFWAEAVSTACYVQNRVLVVKPHNKTPYELFRGFKPALSFMRPFGCHVTILDTLDSLGKFDGRSDEGFFVGYSLSSKAFRVYNNRTKRVEENLHIGFLENKPMIEGTGPKWLFDIDSLTQSMNYVPVTAGTVSNNSASTSEENSQDCIMMPIWKDTSYFDSPTKDVDNGEPKTADDAQKQVEDGLNNENSKQESLKLNDVGPSVSTASPNEKDSTEEEPEVNLGNITNSYIVPTTPNTRIHKDHPIDNVIGEIQSIIEPTSIAKALSNSSWVEAMQEELLQFKLQQVWILVDLPNGKKAIGTKWVFRNKKDERGVVIRNKTRIKEYDHPDNALQVVKALYGLHQAPRAWYETLANYLLSNRFKRGKIDQPLFIKKQKGDILLVQDKYVAKILKKFNYSDVKSASTPVDLEKPLVKDGDTDDVDGFSSVKLVAYTDSDYAVAILIGCLQLEISLAEVGISQEVGTQRYLSLVVPLTKVGDEAVHKELGDRMERAATTASSLEAEQDSGSGPRCQDTILGDVNAQTRFEITSIQSINPPLLRGYTLGSGDVTRSMRNLNLGIVDIVRESTQDASHL
ncbi:uncharacterized mitochondrial protein-like protein [Tanacetum coccineum]|uniref:Uncharacterized mitochondrial protein-like protein n=1 Tax=Tanacetum coccineum TaxID=301880 RepID=A0ABQ4Z7A1_9ASTR